MQYVEPVAKYMKNLFKDLPHLPKGLTKWLAENAWWLTLIGVILGAIAVVTTLGALGVVSLVATVFVPVVGIALVGVLISLLVLAAVVALQAMAIKPLQDMKRRGWELLFLAAMVSGAGGVLADLVRYNIFGAVFSALGFAIAAYVLLELERYFVKK